MSSRVVRTLLPSRTHQKGVVTCVRSDDECTTQDHDTTEGDLSPSGVVSGDPLGFCCPLQREGPVATRVRGPGACRVWTESSSRGPLCVLRVRTTRFCTGRECCGHFVRPLLTGTRNVSSCTNSKSFLPSPPTCSTEQIWSGPESFRLFVETLRPSYKVLSSVSGRFGTRVSPRGWSPSPEGGGGR